jgi:hypothetical protein
MEEIDITKLFNSSGKDLYEDTDPRQSFIEEAVSTVYNEKFGSDVAKTKTSFCHNIVESFLKARYLRFVWLKSSDSCVHI